MAQEIIFNLGVNGGNAEAKTDGLKKSVDETGASVEKMGDKFQQQLDEIKKRVDSGTLTQRQLTKAVKEYQTIALQAGETSPVGLEAIREAGALTDRLGDVQRAVQVTAQEAKGLQAALAIGQTVVAGYGALQGIQALVGAENENLTKTLVKLQAVQTVLASVEQIRNALKKEEVIRTNLLAAKTTILTVAQTVYTAAVGTSTGAMKALRLAMLALPIVAIIAGIVALVGVIASLFGQTEKAQAATDRLNASITANAEATELASDKIMRSIQNRIRMLELQGGKQQEINKLELEELDAIEAKRQLLIKAELNSIIERTKNLKQARREENADLVKSISEELRANYKKFKELSSLDGQAAEDRKAKILEQENEIAEEQKERNEKARDNRKREAEKRKEEEKKRAEELLNLQRQFTDLTITNIADEATRERMALAEKHRRELEDLRKQYGERAELITQLELNQAEEKKRVEADIKIREDAATKEADAKVLEQANVSAKAALEAKLLNDSLEFEARQMLLTEQAVLERDQALQNEALTAGEKLKIEAEYTARIKELDAEQKQSEEDKNAALAASRLAMQQNVQTVISSISQILKANTQAQKVAAIADVAIQAATGFVDGLRLAQKAALETPTPIGKALVFASFAATQALAVKKVVDQAKSIIGAGPSVSPPSIPAPSTSGGQGQAANGQDTGNALAPNSVTQIVLPIDSLKKAQSQSEIVQSLSTLGG